MVLLGQAHSTMSNLSTGVKVPVMPPADGGKLERVELICVEVAFGERGVLLSL